MRMNRQMPVIIFILVLITFVNIYPCTSFIYKNGEFLFMGHNFDWITGTGLLIVNPGNLCKASLVDSSETPVEWTSKFGSITFNQVGRELPFGGMNERGLAIVQMGLNTTVYPSKDSRPVIGACQWIQFQLDNFETVEEVIHSDSLLRIVDTNSKFHYLAGDRFGNSAVIEFLEGRMVSYTSENLPLPVLANSSYAESIDCYKKKCDTQMNRSLFNFCTAAGQIQSPNRSNADSPVDGVFDILNSVSQGPLTKWSIVFDISEMKIYFKCFETPTIVGERKIFLRPPGEAKIKIVSLNEFSFSCHEKVKVLDVHDPNDGEVNTYFMDYSKEINLEFIREAFTFYKNWGASIELNDEIIEYMAGFPESFHCMGTDGK